MLKLNLEKWSDQAQIFRESFYLPNSDVSIKDSLFWDMELFLFKNHMFYPKMPNNYKLSDNVFAISVCNFIKIALQLQNLQLITSIYPNKKSMKFHKLWLLKQWFVIPYRLKPSIVATR